MGLRLASLAAFGSLLLAGQAHAGAVRADLAEAYGAWQAPDAVPSDGPHAAAIGLDLQVPRDLGCVRTRDPSTGITIRCVTDPSHRSTKALVEAQKVTEGGLRPIVFEDLGSVLAMRLRDHLEQRFEQVDVDRGPIPVSVKLKYDIHSGRFGERDMRVELVASLEGEDIEVVGHSRDRLPRVHMAWFVPTVPLAGAGLIMLDRVDREAVAAQAVATVDHAAQQLAEALAARQLERGLGPPRPPQPEPVGPAPAPVVEPEPAAPPVAAVEPAPHAPRVKLPRRPSRCDDLPASRLSSLSQEAVVAFVTHDDDSFRQAADLAAQALPCVSEVVLPPQVAEFHRLVALRAWYAGDRQAAELAFRASLALEPSYRLSTKVAPEGGALRASWDRARDASRSRSLALQPPAGARAWVDGRVGSSRPMDLPTLVQLGTPPDQVGWTGYLGPGGALPGQRDGSTLALVPFAFIRSAEHSSEAARWGLPETVERLPAEPAVEPPQPAVEPDFPPNPLLEADELEVVIEDEDLDAEPAAPSRGERRADRRQARPDLVDAPVPTLQQPQRMRNLALATGGAAVLLYGSSHASRWRFDHDGPSPGLMVATNGAYIGSIGMGLTSATFTTLWLMGRSR